MRLFKIAASAALMIPAFCANEESEAAKRINAAATVMTEIMSTSDKAIPQDLLNKAECIGVIPGLKKGAFIVGGKYGRGFVTCRKSDGVGWGAPASVRIEGGSFGFQIGGAETDVVMLIMNRSGAEKLTKSRFTLGGDASVAAGPVGRDASAQTDAMMNAQILTYSRQRGVFAGVSLSGATMREDTSWNQDLYGTAYKNADILAGKVPATPPTQPLLTALNKYSSRK